MASVYDLKPRFQNLLRPVCAALARTGATANQVTIGAAVLCLAEGLAIFFSEGAAWSLILLPLVLFVRMALNAIDGMLAREFGHKTRLGTILNELGDVVADIALYLPFATIAGLSPTLIGLVVALGVMTEMAGIVAAQIGAARRYDGPFGKSDRALFFGALGLVLAAGATPALWADIVLGLAAVAALLTVIRRARAALGETA